MSVVSVADGPAMYLGSSMMSFALPLGAFIVISCALFVLLRAKHSSPRLKYLPSNPVTSVTTREPGPVPAPAAKASAPESVARPESVAGPEATAAPEATAGSEATAAPEAVAGPEATAEPETTASGEAEEEPGTDAPEGDE